jgi:TonB-dependent starch-binding outer membrane protein SusC
MLIFYYIKTNGMKYLLVDVGQRQLPPGTFSLKKYVLFISLLYCSFISAAQSPANEKTITVKGTVTDQAGDPMGGVTITVKGDGKTIVTEPNGTFELTVPANSVLVVSYVGFVKKEIKTGTTDQLNLSIPLVAGKNEMDEVVVIGYGTRRKSDITGAIVSVNEQAIKDIPAANLAQALQGRAAGIDIQKNGGNNKPGAAPSILIRGSRSVRAGNEPLIVVDGIPFNGSFNDINQDDVTSVEILKDASSTAIYGSRGANGVILISTKRGKAGKPVITYGGYAGFVKPIGEHPMMDAQEFALFKKWALYNGRFEGNNRVYTSIDDPVLLDKEFSPEEKDAMTNGRGTNWQKLMYDNGMITNHNIGISGGTDVTQYALSGGYFKETGVYPGQAFERFSVKLSIDQQLSKHIKIGLNSLNSYTTTQGESSNPMAQAMRASPLASPYNTDGTLRNDFVVGSASQVWNPLADFLPGAVVERKRRYGTNTTLYVDLSLAKGLKYRFNAGAEIRNELYSNYYASKTSKNLGSPSTSTNRNNLRNNYTLEHILTYDKTFAKKHAINFTGLYSIQQEVEQQNQISNDNVLSGELEYYNPNLGANLKAEGDYTKWNIISYMGRLNYSFDERYLLTLTLRSDGSSRLAPGNKYKTFPSAAVAWIVNRENFLSNVQAISNLKLRASLGQVGNAAINPYQTLGSLTPVVYNYGPGTNTIGIYLGNIPNPNLTWEYTTTANIGLDFGLLNNRVSGSIEFYKQFTSSLLLPQTLPPTSGIPNAILTNVGKTENKGIELQLSTVNMMGRGRNSFSWTTDLNIFINRGKITELAGGATRDVANGWFVGYPIGSYYGYQKLGIWQNTPADSALAKTLGLTLTGANSVIGDIKVADLSGPKGKPDSVLNDTYDRMILGSNQPKWEGGMTNRFSYRGFDLSIVVFARWGSMMRSALHGAGFANTYQGTYNNLKARYWTPGSGENEFPKPNSNRTNAPNRDLLGYFDGSFVKIRSISLGYNLAPPMLKKVGAKNIRIYATAEDPFILFSPFRRNKYGGLDPEAGGSASSPSVATLNVDTPPNWSMIFGVNVSF